MPKQRISVTVEEIERLAHGFLFCRGRLTNRQMDESKTEAILASRFLARIEKLKK